MVRSPATSDDLDETGRLVQSAKRRWIGVKTDICDMPAMKAAVDRALKEFGKLDIVVANAGAAESAPFTATSIDLWERMLAVK